MAQLPKLGNEKLIDFSAEWTGTGVGKCVNIDQSTNRPVFDLFDPLRVDRKNPASPHYFSYNNYCALKKKNLTVFIILL